jgi:phage shock protein PspC (stress-responsive transcriptional regulator)
MTNEPADAARPETPPNEATEPSFAPPMPPPGPLWPGPGADSAASAGGRPSIEDAVPTPPSGAGPAPSGSPTTPPASAESTTATPGATPASWPDLPANATPTSGAAPTSGAGFGTVPTSGAGLGPGYVNGSAPASGAGFGAAPTSGPAAAGGFGPASAPPFGSESAHGSGSASAPPFGAGPAGTGAGANPGSGFPGFGSALGAAFGPAFKARYGLVRPVTGRHFAGVCAAVGRATNTDPVLWRVLFAVLTLFGGVGLLAYLIGWLLIPADGDTASPIEAVLGRGRSRTSGPIAVIGAVVAILVFALVASEGLRPAVVGALVVLGAAVLLSRGTLQRPGNQQADPGPAPFQPEPVMPAPPHPAPGFTSQFGAPPFAVTPATTPTHATPASTPPAATVPAAATPATPEPAEPITSKAPLDEAPAPDSEETAVEPDRRDDAAAEPAYGVPSAVETPTLPQPAQPPQRPQPPYGPPFAPHGPFGPPGPYPPAFGPMGPQQPTRRLPLYGPYPQVTNALPMSVSADPFSHYPGMPYSVPPVTGRKPKVKRPRSRLGRATLSAAAIALGTLAIVHVAGVSIAGSAYFAVALAVVGLGLVVGAWIGRARLLIPLGFALSLGMLIATASTGHDYSGDRGRPDIFNPTTVAEITANNPYERDAGDVTLDFSQIDFTGQDIAFEATTDIGRLEVILPPNVDVEVIAKVEVGDANVLNRSWGGLSDKPRTVIDEGDDGPGGGRLLLTLTVDVGNLEVHR